MKKKLLYILLLVMISLQLVSCANEDESVKAAQQSQTEATEGVGAGSELFSQRDFDSSYDVEKAVRIELSAQNISCDSEAVEYSDGKLWIKDEGSYILQGSLEGMLVIEAEKSDKIQVVLDNAEIISNSAAIYVKQADKLFITLAENSENCLSNLGSFESLDENNIDAVIFSRDDLTLNGSGSLNISSPGGHGVVSKDSLTVTGGSYVISSAANGFEGKDDVSIAGGSFEIVSDKDGIKAENDEDEAAGFVFISGGSFNIKAGGDAVSASGKMQIDGGSFEIFAGGGHENAAGKNSAVWGRFMGGMERPGGERFAPDENFGAKRENLPELPERMKAPENMGPAGFAAPDFSEQAGDAEVSAADEGSMKGFKAGTELTINGGSFFVDSADDAFHSDLNMRVNSGEFEIFTGDDGFHAEEELEVNGGSINISQSYEGLEALHLSILGGQIEIFAEDDGLNAAGGTDFSGFGGRDAVFGGPMGMDSGGSISIGAGDISITAYGDGLDANGSVAITGGSILVCGPDYGDTSILDYSGTASISGGSFIGSGSSMMAQSFSNCGQAQIVSSFEHSISAGSTVELTDSGGKCVLSFVPGLDFQMLLISSPELSKEISYSISIANKN